MSDTNERRIDGDKPLTGENLVRSRLERYGQPHPEWNDWGKTWDQDPNWDRVIYDRES